MPIAKIPIIFWMALSAVSRASRFFSFDTKKEKRFSELRRLMIPALSVLLFFGL